MNRLDIYYRALAALRAETEKEPARQTISNTLRSSASGSEDFVDYIERKCNVDEEWVSRIEEALPHIEKAVEEQRRLIKKEGQVVRIDQARKTSGDSIRHLARHSNLITRVPEEGEDIVPDKLYVSENTENFHLYENRFIYTLLKYLDDFVETRYKAIVGIDNSEIMEMRFERNLTVGSRKFSLFGTYHEDGYAGDGSDSTEMNPIVLRLIGIRGSISTLLASPLMSLFSGEHMLTPPIVRTNIIKMNLHFRIAFDLFSYILSYTKNGYEIVERREKISPLDVEAYDELSDIVLVNSLIAHEVSGKRELLKAAYIAENQRRAEKEAAELEKRLTELKEAFIDGTISPEKYVIELENKLNRVKAERDRASASLGKLAEELEEKTQKLALVEEDLGRITERASTMRQQWEERLGLAAAEYNRLIEEKNAEMQTERESFETVRIEQQKAHLEQLAEREKLHEAAMKELKISMNAEIRALRHKNGLPQEEGELTSKELFELLTAEKDAFDKLYRDTWRKTKKRIRKELLWTKNDGEADIDASENTVNTEEVSSDNSSNEGTEGEKQ